MCDVKRVCVIGAGTAGLCAVKHSVDQGFHVVCYEQGKEIGGTWIYSENSDPQDEFQNSMYEGLLTNLPKEVMGYPDFLFPNDTDESFITSDRVLHFLQLYATHFQLHKFIKLRHEVLRVRPKTCKANGDDSWEVIVNDIEANEFKAEFFDFVFVCNGHFTKPMYPVIENMDNYRGKQIHSHFYKTAKSFEGETVLIVGGGPSGIDIACRLNGKANRVFLSHHSKSVILTLNIIQKPDIERFTEDGAVFKDGTTEIFSVVIYSTGYKYSFPFLSVDCDVRIEDNSVQPLFKHVININHPSMAFIGLPFKVLPTQIIDLQIRFVLKYLTNEKTLPSREEMLKDLDDERKERLESGLPLRRFHEMAQRQFQYYDDLASLADVEPIKPVISKIMKACGNRFIHESETYRDYSFVVLDDSNYEKIKIKDTH